jgi:hypothetical protein
MRCRVLRSTSIGDFHSRWGFASIANRLVIGRALGLDRRGERLLRSSLEKIREWFTDIDAAGPIAVANFLSDERWGAMLRRVRDPFETVDRFLRDLGLWAAVDTAIGPVDWP